MKKPLIIGITGGIGGGKSTLANMLRERGYCVYDTDQEAKRLQNNHPEIKKQLVELFGEDIYANNQLDRKKLAGIVFSNPELLKKLNNIVHPIVREDFFNWQKKYDCGDFLFVESAILFESGLDKHIDKVIVVTAPEKVRIERVVKRDGVTPEQVRDRMKRQIPEEEKIKRADIVVNSEGKNALTRNLEKIIAELENLSIIREK